MHISKQSIAHEAYLIWLSEGCPDGNLKDYQFIDMTVKEVHWMLAEMRLMLYKRIADESVICKILPSCQL